MNIFALCLGVFLFISFISTLLFVAASINSSRISLAAEGYYESQPIPKNKPAPARIEVRNLTPSESD